MMLYIFKNMRKLLIALFVVCVLPAAAQGVVSPKVRMLKERYAKQVARTRGEVVAADARVGLFVTCEKDADARRVADALQAKGGGVRVVKGRQIVLDMPLTGIEALAATEGVAKVDLGPQVSKKTDVTRRATAAVECNAGAAPLPQAYTGKGVIVGIIDNGFDPTHPMFKDQDGNLRVKGFYMPGNTTFGGDSVRIDGFTLTGSCYSQPEDILDRRKVRGESDESHGTSCLSVAAGSIMDDAAGLSGEPLGGIAPEAELLICNSMSDDEHYYQLMEAGYNVEAFNIAECLDYMTDQAKQQQKPLVVSISMNSHVGWHNGMSNMAKLLGDFCRQDGVALLLSTGNEGDGPTYVNRSFAAGEPLHMGFKSTYDGYGYGFCCLPTSKKVKLEMSLYDFEHQEELYRLPMALESDNSGQQLFYFDLPFEDDYGLTLRERVAYRHLQDYIRRGSIYVDCYKGNAYDVDGNIFDCTYVDLNHVDIEWNRGHRDQSRKIGFVLHLTTEEDTEIHSWGDYYEVSSQVDGSDWVDGRPDYSTGDWSSSGEPVSVGAWTANNQYRKEGEGIKESDKEPVGAACTFSSFGYDLAGHTFPDVCAPGRMIAAALSSFETNLAEDEDIYFRKGYTDQYVGQRGPQEYTWGWMSGTSVSTPAAAGVVALWMQAAADMGKTLTSSDIKDIIAHSSDTDEFTAREPERFGHGKINAYKGLLYVLGIDTAIEGLSKDQPANVNFRVAGEQLYADGAEDGTAVALYDLSGVLVRQTAVQGGTVSLAGLQQGVYAVQLGKLGSTLIRK